jgi:hypothetical protein
VTILCPGGLRLFVNEDLEVLCNMGPSNLTGHRHGKLFISGPCRKRADSLLRLSRYQLKMVVAILTGHDPVRKHLRTVGLFERDPTCRFCRKEAEPGQHIICCGEALARQRYNVLGVWRLNQQTYVQPQLGTCASSYEAQGYGIWAENSI